MVLTDEQVEQEAAEAKANEVAKADEAQEVQEAVPVVQEELVVQEVQDQALRLPQSIPVLPARAAT